jgi:hypothetical protein
MRSYMDFFLRIKIFEFFVRGKFALRLRSSNMLSKNFLLKSWNFEKFDKFSVWINFLCEVEWIFFNGSKFYFYLGKAAQICFQNLFKSNFQIYKNLRKNLWLKLNEYFLKDQIFNFLFEKFWRSFCAAQICL